MFHISVQDPISRIKNNDRIAPMYLSNRMQNYTHKESPILIRWQQTATYGDISFQASALKL